MLQTSRRKISYPNPDRSDRPDVPAHLQILAFALDQDVIFNTGLDSDRTAAAHQVGGGRVWWSTDTLVMWYDDGTNWRSLGNAPLNSPAFTGTPTAPTPPPGDNDTSIATTEFVNQFFPVGAIIAYAGGTAPTGWLICDGSAVDRTAYSNLFGAISTAYGPGNGTTTFNIPDLRGRVPVGKNNATFNLLGKTGGEETHVVTVAEMPAHSHTFTGSALPTHTHVFTGSGLPDHYHRLTQQEPDVIWADNFTRSGTGIGMVSMDGQSSRGSGFAFDIISDSEADVGGTKITLTPAGSNASVSAGTPSGTNANTGGGTAANNLQPYLTINYLIKV